MKVLVTGSAGHLGEALVRTLRETDDEPIGLDIKNSPYTAFVGSVVDREFVRRCVSGVDVVLHTATLHKPHVGTHSRQAFVDTNITGTLNLLEEAVTAGCQAFVFTSTTSAFGDAMQPAEGGPAVWVTEELVPKPKNIYGVTKTAAEDLCALFHRNAGLPCVVLRTSRFFPELDDDKSKREAFTDDNLKVNELLFRRADIADITSAHVAAYQQAPAIGFDRFIITATSPFKSSDAGKLAVDAPGVVQRYVPGYVDAYAHRHWHMLQSITRVYDNSHARRTLGWSPQYSFAGAIEQLAEGRDYRSELARAVGLKRYHDQEFADGPYPTDDF